MQTQSRFEEGVSMSQVQGSVVEVVDPFSESDVVGFIIDSVSESETRGGGKIFAPRTHATKAPCCTRRVWHVIAACSRWLCRNAEILGQARQNNGLLCSMQFMKDGC